MKPTRKPVHLELVGGKCKRQRCWEVIRRQREQLTVAGLTQAAQVEEDTAQSYMRPLMLAGFLELTQTAVAVGEKQTYRLVKDNGVEAPRVTAKGKLVTQGLKTESLWRVMRALSQRGSDFCPRDLIAAASTPAMPVSLDAAKVYLRQLAKAGYLQVTRPSRGRDLRYRLTRNTGPRPPMVQRSKSIFDPNLNKVVWTEQEAEHEPA